MEPIKQVSMRTKIAKRAIKAVTFLQKKIRGGPVESAFKADEKPWCIFGHGSYSHEQIIELAKKHGFVE